MTDRRPAGESGPPVPVRDLLKQAPEGAKPAEPASPSAAGAGASGAAAPPPLERSFEVAGEEWLARPAGIGLYGTGRPGSARLMAVHFFRASAVDEPVREALVPAGEFASLGAGELSDLFERATPIELAR